MSFRRRRYLSLLGTTVAVGSAGCAEIARLWGKEEEGQSQELPLNPTQEAKLTADDGGSGDFFGWAVDLSSDGTTALVSADSADSSAADGTGAAYIFDGSDGSWTQQTKLAPETGYRGDLFGSAVALSSDGTTALVGAGNAEAVYVFDGGDGAWTQQSKLSGAGTLFGVAVALSNDGTTAIVGSQGSFSTTGSAYVYDGSGGEWDREAAVSADDGADSDNFGQSVALSGDGTTALVGEFGNVAAGGDAGMVYVFDGADGSWTQQATLTADDGADEDVFGWAVALSRDGTTALVGARGDDNTNGADSGAAYVFDRSDGSWTQRTKLTPVGGTRSDRFGQSVALSSDGSVACIGADQDAVTSGYATGSVHVFDGSDDEWSQTGRFTADDGDSGDLFGWAVALSGDGTTSLVGALQDEDPNGDNGGSAYVFTL